jgi:dienelactone hydrolase
VIRLLAVAALSFTVVAAQQAPAPVAAPSPETRARDIVALLITNNFGKIEALYDTSMKAALPPGALGTSWATAAHQFGAFQSITAARTQAIGDNQVVLLSCRFEQFDVTLRFVFNAAGELAGLASLSPVSRAVWLAPDYVDATTFDDRAVSVHTGHWDLPGSMTIPKAAGKHPAVVLVHGSGPNDMDESIGPNRMFKDLAYGLSSQGIVVLRFEKRTHKYGTSSSDDPARFTVKDEEMDDADAAVSLLDAEPEVDPAHVFLGGHSEGGYLAPRIAAGNPHITGLILLAGNARPLEDLIVEQVRYQAKLAGPITPVIQKAIDAADASARDLKNPDLTAGMTVNVLGAPVPASYVLDLRTYHPTEVAASLTIPMLVLQGERDYQVTMTDFSLWRDALSNHANVTFKSYFDLNHFFFSGSGPSRPTEYNVPAHVSRAVVADIAAWCQGR